MSEQEQLSLLRRINKEVFVGIKENLRRKLCTMVLNRALLYNSGNKIDQINFSGVGKMRKKHKNHKSLV